MFLTVSLALTVSLLLVSLPELLLFLGWGLAEQLAVFLAASLVVLAITLITSLSGIWLYSSSDALADSSSVELIVWGYVWLFGQCFWPRSTVRLPGPDSSHGPDWTSPSMCWCLSLGLYFCMVDRPLGFLLALQKGGYHTESLYYRKWLFPCLRSEHVLWWGNWTDSRGRTLSGGEPLVSAWFLGTCPGCTLCTYISTCRH